MIRWSEKLSAFVEQNYAFRILPNNTGLSGVAFRLDAPGHPPTVAPEEVGAHVLRKLLDNAYRYLGHKQVRTAVIAVPAKFDETQRVATARAFELAGLKGAWVRACVCAWVRGCVCVLCCSALCITAPERSVV